MKDSPSDHSPEHLSGGSDSFEDLVQALYSQNASRYEVMTRKLMRSRRLEEEVSGSKIKFTLGLVGLKVQIIYPNSTEFETMSWVRLGLSRKAQRDHIPLYLAQNEASAITYSNT